MKLTAGGNIFSQRREKECFSTDTLLSGFSHFTLMDHSTTPDIIKDTDAYGRPSPWKFIRQNDVASLKAWLDDKENEDCIDDLSSYHGGLTLMHLAAAKGKLEVCRLLHQYKADVNILTAKGCRAIHLAARHNQVDIVQFLLEETSASTEDLTSDGWYPLHEAANNNKAQAVHFLASNGAKLDCVTLEKYETPLMQASKNGHLDAVKALLEYKPNVNAANKSGYTAVMAAAALGHIHVVQTLCEKGADLMLKSKKGSTCVHLAARYGDVKLLKLLDRHTAPIFEKTLDEWNALHEAADTNQPEVIEYLLKRGLSIDSKTETGNTALHIAIRKCHVKSIEIICNSVPSPDVTTRNKTGDSAISLSEQLQLEPFLVEMIRRAETPKPKVKTPKTIKNSVAFNVEQLRSPTPVDETDASVADIFLSYSWSQSKLVEQLYHDLTGRGYRVWLDRYKIKPGDKLQSKLHEGVSNCKVFLPCLSKDYLQSDNCNNEFHLAKCRKKTIVPLIFDPSVVEVWPPTCELAPLLAPLVYLIVCDSNYSNLEMKQVDQLCAKLDSVESDHSLL